ncbi:MULTISPECIES: methylated-DNA--[protein]-cysteine S-methyltransferase [unclassified Marinobacterium]|uniref:methylated-DNA--[protein]-cysteine S-methyltransferase n=1 Tax=unclassified Marinobacterium TaxID=2644139 RepID=UPI00156953FE|nr:MULTISPECIES: MGMT family protein [unclassified Marinobacterium]NRP27930.1 Bifunctional transcriptional activator/DNA repair enzyme Ada [Marinobacterium sp. xm-d-420]NRP56810.1 Bifunctional transcriptional activator/DNA repair enzyme Ada [Marinobacterium sp. xm-d-510]NRP59850.1 Bifunctional transcriptional activator/DNA repair enzyme Ada [Marinobacterium sp. xm-d-564]NRP96401.1 Bifunctional transcriptional activator/DNA repair enzyme Ada [Marinobacterium sp. xm-a-127]
MSHLELIALPKAHLQNQGSQLDILTGDIRTEFGVARSAWFNDRLLFLGFYEGDEVCGWDDLSKRFANANWYISNEKAVELFGSFCHQPKPSAWVIGTEFQKEVWQAVCQIPEGDTVSYSQLALNIKKPKAVRAVGSALGANNIAYWVPCHRAVRSDGSLGGYRWGVSLKAKLLSAEATDL